MTAESGRGRLQQRVLLINGRRDEEIEVGVDNGGIGGFREKQPRTDQAELVLLAARWRKEHKEITNRQIKS